MLKGDEFMFFDCHTHTVNSDGKNTVWDMCDSATNKGISGITITDHANINFYKDLDTFNKIKQSIADTTEAKEKFRGKLKVLKGIELGEYTYAPKKADEVLSLGCFDAVLCSVHLVPKAGWSLAYNRIDFSDPSISDNDINEYIKLYFDLLSETVDCFDFDILAHIQCPARYITGKFGRKTNVMLFEEKIGEILEKIIKRNIALEINTAWFCDDFGNINFQTEEILKLYKSLGGKMITLGSDAHTESAVARNFSEASALIKKCGFNSLCYFENRQPREILM